MRIFISHVDAYNNFSSWNEPPSFILYWIDSIPVPHFLLLFIHCSSNKFSINFSRKFISPQYVSPLSQNEQHKISTMKKSEKMISKIFKIRIRQSCRSPCFLFKTWKLHSHPLIYILFVWRKIKYNKTQVKGLNFEKVFREFRMR